MTPRPSAPTPPAPRPSDSAPSSTGAHPLESWLDLLFGAPDEPRGALTTAPG